MFARPSSRSVSTSWPATLYDRGVIADVSTDIDVDGNGTIVLHTYNCPYHELAQDHREICDMDQKMIRQVLGSDVNLTECMMDGHGSCSFVVSRYRVEECQSDKPQTELKLM